jgi:hypothetical protein
MAHERIPPDPNRPGFNEDYRDPPQRLEEDLQIDPELAEGPASGGRIALFAICIALVLGAVFYGLNNSSINETQPASPPPAQGARDATPKANTEPGQTTGAATNRPTPPASAPAEQEVDRSAGQKQ